MNPPLLRMSLTAGCAATAAAAADPASARSNHRACPERRSRSSRRRQPTITGAVPSSSAAMSATAASARISPAKTSACQRRPARSRISHMTSSGTMVPMWSGDNSSVLASIPSAGESMIPSASSILAAASRPVTRPLASSAASSTTSV